MLNFRFGRTKRFILSMDSENVEKNKACKIKKKKKKKKKIRKESSYRHFFPSTENFIDIFLPFLPCFYIKAFSDKKAFLLRKNSKQKRRSQAHGLLLILQSWEFESLSRSRS